jgi:hypothetical protein
MLSFSSIVLYSQMENSQRMMVDFKDSCSDNDMVENEVFYLRSVEADNIEEALQHVVIPFAHDGESPKLIGTSHLRPHFDVCIQLLKGWNVEFGLSGCGQEQSFSVCMMLLRATFFFPLQVYLM